MQWSDYKDQEQEVLRAEVICFWELSTLQVRLCIAACHDQAMRAKERFAIIRLKALNGILCHSTSGSGGPHMGIFACCADLGWQKSRDKTWRRGTDIEKQKDKRTLRCVYIYIYTHT